MVSLSSPPACQATLAKPVSTLASASSSVRQLSEGENEAGDVLGVHWSLTGDEPRVSTPLVLSPFQCFNPRKGFPSGSVVKSLPASAGTAGLIPGSGRSPVEGNGNPLQYSCL